VRLHYLSSGPRERVLARILEDGHDVLGVWTTDPARWPKVASTVDVARKAGISHRVLRRADLAAPPADLAGATCISVGFGLVLPAAFLDHVAICLNVHGTLLPDYRGARTLNWVIANGERESGVTVHVVDEGVDTGPILLQKRFPLSPFETGPSLARKTLAFEPDVVSEALKLFESLGVAAARPQPLAGNQVPDRVPDHSRIDPSRPLAELIDAIRAADPERYPAFFDYAGQKVCIRLWRPEKPAGEDDLI
jgi:methionyl-tRNA formyltransferase